MTLLLQTQSFLENILLISDYVDKRIIELQSESSALPKGSVHIRKKGGRCYFYHYSTIDKKRAESYVPRSIAVKLAGKIRKRIAIEQSLRYWKIIQTQLSDKFYKKYCVILEEIKLLQSKEDETINTTISLLKDAEKDIFLFEAGRIFSKLQNSTTIRLHNSNDTIIHLSKIPSKYGSGNIETLDGDFTVRSKSELIIMEQLKAKGVEFYYEQGVVLENRIFYPDFLIRHPISKDFMIWEHCGLMDSVDYLNNWQKKLNTYVRQNIIPFRSIIFTYEDNNNGFSIKNVRGLIDLYFS